jgi:chromate transporter
MSDRSTPAHDASTGRSSGIGELARVFLKLGATAFGGPAAHIAFMHEEVVVRRRWLAPQEFLDLVGATNLIPGPNSTELAIHIGYRRHGWRGLLTAGACFILPAVIIVWVLAALYVRIGTIPDVRAVFEGIAPVLVVIVGIALWRLGHTAIRSIESAAIAFVSLAALAAGAHELLVLGIGTAAGALLAQRKNRTAHSVALTLAWPFVAATGVAGSVTLSGLFEVFFKAGALLFGSGYVLFAFLRTDLVTRTGWLTESQLIDAIAIGQITPGPLFTTATFVGYLLARSSGAVVATVAIFLPAFVYVALSGRLVPRLRESTVAAGALDGVNAASLAMMALVNWQLARVAISGVTMVVLATVALVTIVRWRINPTWLILAGGLVGWIGGAI